MRNGASEVRVFDAPRNDRELVVSQLGHSGHVIRMTALAPGDFFGEMTLIEMQNRSATVVAESPTVLYELTAQSLYACTRPTSMPM